MFDIIFVLKKKMEHHNLGFTTFLLNNFFQKKTKTFLISHAYGRKLKKKSERGKKKKKKNIFIFLSKIFRKQFLSFFFFSPP